MTAEDVLAQLFDAWRKDIDSVPLPEFTTLLIPEQTRRRPLPEQRPGVERVKK